MLRSDGAAWAARGWRQEKTGRSFAASSSSLPRSSRPCLSRRGHRRAAPSALPGDTRRLAQARLKKHRGRRVQKRALDRPAKSCPLADLVAKIVRFWSLHARIQHQLIYELMRVYGIAGDLLLGRAGRSKQNKPHLAFVPECEALHKQGARQLDGVAQSLRLNRSPSELHELRFGKVPHGSHERAGETSRSVGTASCRPVACVAKNGSEHRASEE